METNPFAHIVNNFQGVSGKYIGKPVQGEPNPLPSALAAQGGTSAETANALQTQNLQPAHTPILPNPQLTRNLPNMQTSPMSALQGAFQNRKTALPVTAGTPSNPNVGENPFLSYLNQMFGPGAQRRTNLKFPSYLRNIPVQGNRAVNPMAGAQNPYSLTIPAKYSIPPGITSQVGSLPLPNTNPYQVPNATNFQANNPGVDARTLTQYIQEGGSGSQ